MKILSTQSRYFTALPAHYKVIYPSVELADLNDVDVTYGRKTIFIADNMSPKSVIDTMRAKKCFHVLQYNEDYFLSDIETTGMIIDKPDIYFKGQAKSIIKNPLKVLDVEFSEKSEKDDLFEKFDQFLTTIEPQNSRDSSYAILQELYMNAMFDAPKEAMLKFGAKPDKYAMGQKARIMLVASQDRLAISCYDPFGSLNVDGFLARISEVYESGAGQAMRMGKHAGAGIGCMIMFENSDSLLVGVMPGHMTVVTCLIPLGMGQRRRANIKKSLHLIEI